MKHHLLPKCSIISVVRVDLRLLSNAYEAAFLNRRDPAMHPKTLGLELSSCLAAQLLAHDMNTAMLASRNERWPLDTLLFYFQDKKLHFVLYILIRRICTETKVEEKDIGFFNKWKTIAITTPIWLWLPSRKYITLATTAPRRPETAHGTNCTVRKGLEFMKVYMTWLSHDNVLNFPLYFLFGW